MKFLVLLLFGLFVVTLKAMEKEEMQEMFRTMSLDCKNQEEAKDEDVEIMAQGHFPNTTSGTCLMACLYEQFGVVSNKNGQITRTKTNNFLSGATEKI